MTHIFNQNILSDKIKDVSLVLNLGCLGTNKNLKFQRSFIEDLTNEFKIVILIIRTTSHKFKIF